MKKIIFNLKREWYDKIASGEKTVEFRRFCRYWDVRLRNAMMHTNGLILPHQEFVAVFRLGYSRKYPDIERRVTKIDVGSCPYEGWEGRYFRIHFEGGARKLIKCEVCGREVWAEQLYEGLCPTCERKMKTESWEVNDGK